MPHWKKLMDKEMLYAFDLDGRDVTVTIEKVLGGELTGEQGKKTKKPVAHIKGKTKKLALNVTNCTTIEQLTGTSDYEKWTNIRVTLFPTTTQFGTKTVDCIRIRPYLPDSKSKGPGKEATGKDFTQQLADEMAAQQAQNTVPRADEDDDIELDVPGDGATP